ncbi:hypothetical protein BGP77_12125 [Saccharospirillum sp. MSK14-1]|uniref:hypothetical protein n=1 Tax=Saccharospirillum sp. MSK14-1 TaxID=1897632 RepID=UPI000D38E033|nr:hypothetical protein [Saccharospirillum sp. MSK14-1]PTY38450.1 hypothetical protein BGP77_12125 [Saccharospirillum sp. MSK14-1]
MKQLLALIALSLPTVALADWPLAVTLGLESHTGGDRWDSIERSGEPSRDIDLGDGLYFSGGVAAQLPEWPINGRLTLHSRLGVKTVLGEGDDGRYSKLAYPLELGLRYTNDCALFSTLGCGFFIEAGAVYPFSAHYRMAGSQERDDDFETQPGYSLRAGWFVFYLGYWHQRYQLNNEDYDASSLNVGIEVPVAVKGNWGFGRE